jgi:hypothetical protein
VVTHKSRDDLLLGPGPKRILALDGGHHRAPMDRPQNLDLLAKVGDAAGDRLVDEAQFLGVFDVR